MAAGFSLKKNNFNEFKEYLSNYKISNSLKSNYYISKISTSAINLEFIKDINKLSPFGNANANPVFLIENLKIYKPKTIKRIIFFVY